MNKRFIWKKAVCILSVYLISTTGFSQCLNTASTMTGNPSGNWDDCGNATEIYAFETSYGGTNGANGVAEIDALNFLCQSVSGLVVGQLYQLSFNYSKRTNCGLGSVQLDITRPNGVMNSITVNNATWAWSLYSQTFIATATTGSIIINVPAAFSNSCGVIVDNVCLTLISALPIDLLSFEVHKNEQEQWSAIDWKVSSQTTIKSFTVEKSSDLTNWIECAKRQNEEFTAVLGSYSATDYEPFQGINYYRLRMEDSNGEITYSQIKSLFFKGNNQLSFYPNPTNGIVHIEGQMDIENLLVYDVTGKLLTIVPTEVSSSHWMINLEGFEKGTYFVECQGTMYYEIHKINYSY